MGWTGAGSCLVEGSECHWCLSNGGKGGGVEVYVEVVDKGASGRSQTRRQAEEERRRQHVGKL